MPSRYADRSSAVRVAACAGSAVAGEASSFAEGVGSCASAEVDARMPRLAIRLKARGANMISFSLDQAADRRATDRSNIRNNRLEVAATAAVTTKNCAAERWPQAAPSTPARKLPANAARNHTAIVVALYPRGAI